ncbi:hypothetical protein F975_02474 [Acinetobacter sp. ANC 3789]|nr:hypothetical protein F975_02474 [Acinetobacter sp. ANC 3789]
MNISLFIHKLYAYDAASPVTNIYINSAEAKVVLKLFNMSLKHFRSVNFNRIRPRKSS